nr:WD repeat protein,periodic tryptophan protein [Hymenolepis microstoma]
MPLSLVLRSLVPFLARQLEGGRSRHLAFYATWVDSVFMVHASSLRNYLAQTSQPRSTDSQLRLLGMEDADQEKVKECLQRPGILMEHGEFKAFQASLIRLQTALEGVKSSLINRMDGLDATWSYLSQIGRLSRGKKAYPLPLIVSSSETDVEDEEQSLPSVMPMIVDLDEQEEIVQKAKASNKQKKKHKRPKVTGTAKPVSKKRKLESSVG